ncbi:helix-turn-helix domain-containing protein [Chitinophaga japonensis]|uniref:Helix-turn-helix protein n=1 Tax=Chitinophaga japonensis TaxID=104662 RepID=A0A562T6W2_CHIJA|nr:helix-turn-helix domain-containing protein [Chitinophaga japonensis]TWI89281.1 helix-turn-helix protein [Chitinophaga japonensis]
MNSQSEKRITRDQLVTISDLEQLKAELIDTMKHLLKPGGATAAKPWLKSDEVRKLLGISAGKLLTLRANGTLPYTRIGNVIYYKIEDIQQLFERKIPSR